MQEKIVAKVIFAYARLIDVYKLAAGNTEDMARSERRNFEEVWTELLKVTLRELYAVASVEKAVDAKRFYLKERDAVAEGRFVVRLHANLSFSIPWRRFSRVP